MALPAPILDNRSFEQLREELVRRHPGVRAGVDRPQRVRSGHRAARALRVPRRVPAVPVQPDPRRHARVGSCGCSESSRGRPNPPACCSPPSPSGRPASRCCAARSARPGRSASRPTTRRTPGRWSWSPPARPHANPTKRPAGQESAADALSRAGVTDPAAAQFYATDDGPRRPAGRRRGAGRRQRPGRPGAVARLWSRSRPPTSPPWPAQTVFVGLAFDEAIDPAARAGAARRRRSRVVLQPTC